MRNSGERKGVGETLKRLRQEKGISQKTFAMRYSLLLGKPKEHSDISKLEDQKNTTVETMCILSEALEIHPADFMIAMLEKDEENIE